MKTALNQRKQLFFLNGCIFGQISEVAKDKSAVKGMNDILPGAVRALGVAGSAGARVDGRALPTAMCRTPIVEHTQLFVRGIGEVTDIVEREMYSFEDKLNGERLTLRPKASLVRAIIEHNLLYDGGKRMWYIGPMFRHERPQRGRYRQFHQIGAEALGFAGTDVDAELILLAVALWKRLGLTQWRLEINSLGQPDGAQGAPRGADRLPGAAPRCAGRRGQAPLYSNPLRVLDTKNPAMQEMVNAAPKLLDYLGEASLAHLRRRCRPILDANGVPWTRQPASGARPRLLQPHACSSLSPTCWARRAHLRRRPLRLPDRAGGRQAGPGRRSGPWAWSACWSW